MQANITGVADTVARFQQGFSPCSCRTILQGVADTVARSQQVFSPCRTILQGWRTLLPGHSKILATPPPPERTEGAAESSEVAAMAGGRTAREDEQEGWTLAQSKIKKYHE